MASFLTTSPAGAGYRALLGEAQHDSAVAQLMASVAVFDDAARTVLNRAIARGDLLATIPLTAATALVTGPVYYQIIETGQVDVDAPALAQGALAAIAQLSDHKV